jgi:predicted DNA-binding WGR domain protein
MPTDNPDSNVIEQIGSITIGGKNAAAVALGRKGGASTSKAKTLAARQNALKAHAANREKAKMRRRLAEEPTKSS